MVITWHAIEFVKARSMPSSSSARLWLLMNPLFLAPFFLFHRRRRRAGSGISLAANEIVKNSYLFMILAWNSVKDHLRMFEWQAPLLSSKLTVLLYNRFSTFARSSWATVCFEDSINNKVVAKAPSCFLLLLTEEFPETYKYGINAFEKRRLECVCISFT